MHAPACDRGGSCVEFPQAWRQGLQWVLRRVSASMAAVAELVDAACGPAGFRFQWGNPWRFESSVLHHLGEAPGSAVPAQRRRALGRPLHRHATVSNLTGVGSMDVLAAAPALPTGRRPTLLASALEARAAFEWSTVHFNLPSVLRAPRGDGRRVLLVPGFGAGSLSMRPLRTFLRFLGYDARDWTGGRNVGDFEADILRVGAECEALATDGAGGVKAPVTVIGWSLGGVAAREAARLFASSVREVITLGTPIIGGPKYTSIGAAFALGRGLDLDAFEHEVHARNSIGLVQPVTSIFSRSDGVVGWRASVDSYNAHARNIEVSGSHLGLGVNQQVWRAIAETLAG